jgi:hypothetical protein
MMTSRLGENRKDQGLSRMEGGIEIHEASPGVVECDREDH